MCGRMRKAKARKWDIDKQWFDQRMIKGFLAVLSGQICDHDPNDLIRSMAWLQIDCIFITIFAIDSHFGQFAKLLSGFWIMESDNRYLEVTHKKPSWYFRLMHEEWKTKMLSEFFIGNSEEPTKLWGFLKTSDLATNWAKFGTCKKVFI